MKKLWVAAAFALAACGQGAEKAAEPEAPPAPQSLLEQVQAMPAEQQPVFALTQFQAYQAAHPEAQPACEAVRETASLGVVPEDVNPDSIYAAHAGALVFTIQCGPLRTGIRSRAEDHWLVAFTSAAMEPVVVNCASNGRDLCVSPIPRAAPPPPAPTP